MTGLLAWMLVASGLAVVVVRRRSMVVGIVTAQALVLALAALVDAQTLDDVVAGCALALRGRCWRCSSQALWRARGSDARYTLAFRRSCEAGVAVLFALTLVWLVPEIGLESRDAERTVLTLLAFGVVTAGLRRATVLQVLGIVLVENGLAFAALELPGGESAAAIELGVAVDLMFISIVAVIFHQRIFGLFGAGDTAALRSLRD